MRKTSRKYIWILGLIVLFVALIYIFNPKEDPLPVKYRNCTGIELYKIATTYKDSGDHYDYFIENYFMIASTFYEKAIEKGVHEREIYWELFWIYFKLHDNKKSESLLTEALELYPSDIWFRFYRATVRKDLKKFRKAYKDYDLVVNSKKVDFPFYYEAVYERGSIKYKNGDKESAKSDYNIAKKHINYSISEYNNN